MTLLPILSDTEIERQVMAQFPVMPGEKTCRTERQKLNELRNWKRKQLYQQNATNEQRNRDMQSTATNPAPKPCGC